MCIHVIRYAYIAVYMNMHSNLREVVHYIVMHIDMHGNIPHTRMEKYHPLHVNAWR